MANLVQTKKKIALLHRFPKDRIKETNAAFPFLYENGIDVLTFKTFDRLNNWNKFWKSLAWIFYAPMLVIGRGYDVIYCDDSFPIYPIFIRLACPRAKIIIRLGDLHLMYYTSGLLYKFLHFFEVLGWTMVDEIVAISGHMASFVRMRTFTKVSVVLDPVNPDDFKTNLSGWNSIVMFHGLITKNKNIDLLVQAAKRLPDVLFVVLGDGPDRERLTKIAPDNMSFNLWAPFEQVKNFISTCAIGVALRSNNPGNEYVVTSPFLQYGVMGKPCLVTKRKVFGDYAWQFSDVDEMVEKIKILLTRPEEGEKLREYVLEHHSAKNIAQEIWQILS